MDRTDRRRAWEALSEPYADRRDPTGSDAALIDDLLAALADRVSTDREPLVVDVGCGDGARTLANLPDGSVGLDFARCGLTLASERVPRARLCQGEMTTLPFADGVADAITAYHAVFHVPRERHPTVYREFARVLSPGGILLMTLPRGRFETVRRGWMGGSMFFSAPGRATTLQQVADAGFENPQTETVSDPLGSTSEFLFAEREP